MDVGFHPDNRFESGSSHLLIKIDRSEHIPVIAHRDRGHPEFFDTRRQSGNLVRAVEKGVFGMKMQMGKRRDSTHKKMP